MRETTLLSAARDQRIQEQRGIERQSMEVFKPDLINPALSRMLYKISSGPFWPEYFFDSVIPLNCFIVC